MAKAFPQATGSGPSSSRPIDHAAVMTSDVPLQIHPVRTSHHRANGIPYARIVRRRDSGEITRLRTGVFIPTEEWKALGPVNRHRLLVTETISILKSDALASHWSSAVLLGIPCLGSPPECVHVTDVRRGGQSSAHVRHHRERRRPPSVVVDGVPCTSPARTAIDLARTLPFDSALIAMDHVLNRGLSSRKEIAAELESLGRARGSARARLVLSHASELAESPGESLSRARMIQLGAPLPSLQKEFRDDRGLIGRTDFWWEELLLVGEFDGAAKYGVGDGAPQADAKEVFYKEKLREDRIRAQGVRFVRWGWDDAISIPRFTRPLVTAKVLDSPRAPLPLFTYSGRD